MTYADKLARLTAELAATRAEGQASASFGLAKSTSNLFRDRAARRGHAIDLARFNEVIDVDPAAGTVRAEGMTRYVDLVDATLAQGTMPAVVPQLKSITLGGAVAGVGIEATGTVLRGSIAFRLHRVRAPYPNCRNASLAVL